MTPKRPVAALPAAILTLVWLLLAGCASVEPPVARSDKPPAAQFSLTARLSIRVDQRLDVVRLRWKRDNVEERIGFFSPFGSQVAELVQPAGGPATLQRGKDSETAPSINDFTAKLLGVQLDIREMALWTQGAGLTVNETRSIASIDGAVWQVTLEGVAQVEGYDHATRLSAAKEGVIVKMVIEDWRPQ
ncbi:MAG: hypothetical protein HY255_04005 [Betaproteobacteria bacterium]|nr:hypothetical protein [Betaproteobacteria bacterium]